MSKMNLNVVYHITSNTYASWVTKEFTATANKMQRCDVETVCEERWQNTKMSKHSLAWLAEI